MKKNTTNTIADTIIEGLKNGTAPWTKPWTPEQCAAPFNPVTGTVYKGVNFVYLSMVGKSDPRWMTYKQAQSQGWQVRSGEHGRSIQFWKFNEENTDPATGQKETVRRERPVLRTYTVFNADQIDGIPEQEKKEAEEWQRHERAENILDRSGVPIHHVQGDKAAYRPFSDEIIMPEKRQFATADRYYGTALHELGHATGHESRLNRDIHHPFGSREYAKEELRAEIASYMLGMQLGIGHDPENHLAYIDSWVGILEEKPTEIFKACADAEKIQAYVLEYERGATCGNLNISSPTNV
jgi:putative DNA primase/helicase